MSYASLQLKCKIYGTRQEKDRILQSKKRKLEGRIKRKKKDDEKMVQKKDHKKRQSTRKKMTRKRQLKRRMFFKRITTLFFFIRNLGYGGQSQCS